MRLISGNAYRVKNHPGLWVLNSFNETLASVSHAALGKVRVPVEDLELEPSETHAPIHSVRTRKSPFRPRAVDKDTRNFIEWLNDPGIKPFVYIRAEIRPDKEQQFLKDHKEFKGYLPSSESYRLQANKLGNQLRLICPDIPLEIRVPKYWKQRGGGQTNIRHLQNGNVEWSSNGLCYDLLCNGFDLGWQTKTIDTRIVSVQ